MTSKSGSLRDLYIDPSSAWSFNAPPAANGTAAAGAPDVPAGSEYEWLPKSSRGPLLDLTSDLELSQPTSANVTKLLRRLIATSMLQYANTAMVMPWEVASVLLQVQWVPRDAGEPAPELELHEEEVDDAASDTSNENDAYFADPNKTHTRALHRTDEQGYIIRRSVLEEGTRPEYIIPVGSADGVWSMIKRVGRFKTEGWIALWKGLLTSCITEVLSSSLHPLIDGFLQSLLFPQLSPFHQPPLIVAVASHLITGFILSPLDLIRTRLIVQPYMSRHQRYTGPLDALNQILRDEGGLKGIYLHPQLLIPTLLDNGLRPIVSLALPGMVAQRFTNANISGDTHPRAWAMAELAGGCIGLMVTLPIETIRRRLQVQVRGTAKPLKGCVELRPAPYNGVVDAFWHILTEERSDLPLRYPQRRRRPSVRGKEPQPEEKEDLPEPLDEGWSRHTGLGQLYRGLGMRLGASAIMFVLALLATDSVSESGWAEI